MFLMPGQNLTKTISSFCFKPLNRPHCSCVSQTIWDLSHVQNYLIGFLCFLENLWIDIYFLLLYTQIMRFLEQWFITLSCLPLWLITALLMFLLPITDFPCSKGNSDAENSYWTAAGRKYYYKDSIYELRISALGDTEMDFWNLLTGLT